MRRRKVLKGAAALAIAAVAPTKAKTRSWNRETDASILVGRRRYRWSPSKQDWVEIFNRDAPSRYPHWSDLAKTSLELTLRMPAGGPINKHALDAARRVARINRKVGVRTTVEVLTRVDEDQVDQKNHNVIIDTWEKRSETT